MTFNTLKIAAAVSGCLNVFSKIVNVHIGTFLSPSVRFDPEHIFPFLWVFSTLQARLLAQPERVQLLARLRLRSDCLPAPGCCGSQSVPHVHPESQRAAARRSGRPL